MLCNHHTLCQRQRWTYAPTWSEGKHINRQFYYVKTSVIVKGQNIGEGPPIFLIKSIYLEFYSKDNPTVSLYLLFIAQYL